MIYICVALVLFTGGVGMYQNIKELIQRKQMQKAGGDTEAAPFILILPTFLQPFVMIVLGIAMVILQVTGIFNKYPILIIVPAIITALYVGMRSKRFTAMAQQEPEHGLVNKKKKK